MRHIAAALGELALIVALCAGNMAALTRRLDEVDAALAAAQESAGPEELEKARALWESAGVWLHATQPHQAMDAVGEALERARVYLVEGRTAELRAALAAARDGVEALRYRERLTLGNVL